MAGPEQTPGHEEVVRQQLVVPPGPAGKRVAIRAVVGTHLGLVLGTQRQIRCNLYTAHQMA